jgi:hypothetical protein
MGRKTRGWMEVVSAPRKTPMTRWLATSLLVLGLAAPARAEETRLSGSIVSISDGEGTFVLSEVGPWTGEEGEAAGTPRTITLTPDTEYVAVRRAESAPSGFAGDFVETPIGPESITLNDWVTVEGHRDGGRIVATRITLVEVPVAASPSTETAPGAPRP